MFQCVVNFQHIFIEKRKKVTRWWEAFLMNLSYFLTLPDRPNLEELKPSANGTTTPNAIQIQRDYPTRPFIASFWPSVPLLLRRHKYQLTWEVHTMWHILCDFPSCLILRGSTPHTRRCHRYLDIYLRGTRDNGLVLYPNRAKSFELYADADFCGNWYRTTLINDPSNEKPWSCYVLIYTGCPIVWYSKL